MGPTQSHSYKLYSCVCSWVFRSQYDIVMYIVCIHVFVDPANVVSPRPFQDSEKGLVTVCLYCTETVVFLINIALSYAGVICLVRLHD